MTGDPHDYEAEPPVDLHRRPTPPTPPTSSAASPSARTGEVRQEADNDGGAGPETRRRPPAAAAPPVVVRDGDLVDQPPPVDAEPASWGWRGRLRRFSGGLLRLGPGPAEVEHRRAERTVRTPIGGTRLIMVASPKGGTGVTTAALMLGSTLAGLRGGGVAVWDNHETRGSLAARAESTAPQRSVWDLLAHLTRLTSPAASAGELGYYLRPQPTGLDVLTGDADPRRREQIGAAECGAVERVLSAAYRLIVVDVGNDVRAEAWRWTAHRADQLVIPVMIEPDAAEVAAWMCSALHAQGLGALVAAAVTVIMPSRVPAPPRLRQQVLAHFRARTAAVVEVPVDPALAGGTRLVFARTSPASRRGWTAVAAAVTANLAARHTTPPPPPRPRTGGPPAPPAPAPAPASPAPPTGPPAPATVAPPSQHHRRAGER
jgi:MinD-like ATPase involved in chromosome partitioning or flagellar assembly